MDRNTANRQHSRVDDLIEGRLTRRALLRGAAAAGLASAVAPLLAACGGEDGSSSAQTAATEAETETAEITTSEVVGTAELTVAVPSYPGSWDQDFLAFDLVGLALMKNYYPYMIGLGVSELDGVQVQDTQLIENVFAESWEASPDGKTWTLKLKEGLTFPSGNPLTARDVKWSKDRAFAAQANVAGLYRLIGLTKPQQVEVLDEYTVRFTQEFPSLLTDQIQAICLYVFDSKLMQEHATDSDPWARDWASKNPTNGGVYNVTAFEPGTSIELEANSEFPGEPKPAFSKVRMLVIPSASNQRLQLESGDIDVAFFMPRRDAKELEGADGITVISAPSNEFVFVPLMVTKPPFDSQTVRQALAYAIPYDQIISAVFDGQARRSTSIVPLDMPGHVDSGYPYDYDPERAKSLLDSAGGGFSTELVIAQGDPEQEQLAILLQQAFAEIGVEVQIQPLDPATLNDRRAKKTIPMQIASGQYWVNDVQYMVGTSLVEGGFLNYSNYADPEVTRLYEQASRSIDEAQRLSLFEQMQSILAEQVPWLMLGQPNFLLPMRDEVTGWVQPVDNLFRLQYLRPA
jgi:peptide/nickel transport system substrate-binding protein